MTRAPSAAQVRRLEADRIIESAAVAFNAAWITEQRQAGRPLAEIMREITAAQDDVSCIIGQAVMTLVELLTRIADAEDEAGGFDRDDVETQLLLIARRTGPLHPVYGWWPT